MKLREVNRVVINVCAYLLATSATASMLTSRAA